MELKFGDMTGVLSVVGDGRREWRWREGKTDPRPAERAGGEGRSPRQAED